MRLSMYSRPLYHLVQVLLKQKCMRLVKCTFENADIGLLGSGDKCLQVGSDSNA